jgi:hypothetical protein
MAVMLEKLTKCETIVGYELTDKVRGVSALPTLSNFSDKMHEIMQKGDIADILGNVVLQHYLYKKWLACGRGKGQRQASVISTALTDETAQWSQVSARSTTHK